MEGGCLITTVAIQAPHSLSRPAGRLLVHFYFVGNLFLLLNFFVLLYNFSLFLVTRTHFSSLARSFSLSLNTRFLFSVKRKTVLFSFFLSCVELLALLSTVFALLYSQKRYFLLVFTTITQRSMQNGSFYPSIFTSE